jgi:hypothetical protein
MPLTADVIHGDETFSLGEALRSQAENCRALGSPLSHDVLHDLADLSEAGGPLADLLADHRTVRGGDLVGLRLLAAAHRLGLARMAPALPDVVRESLERIPQTNETGRALPLRGALGRVAAAHGQPIRLHELAASAGLNLRADAMPWAHAPQPMRIEIVERAGCDLHPLDVDRAEHRLALASYVWGDDLARFERLRTSFALAHRIPATVTAMSAGGYLSTLAGTESVPGQTLMIWHSATWFYLDRAARSEIRSAIRRIAHRATPSSPVVHASWEWRRDSPDPTRSFALVGRSWPAAGAWAPWRPGTPVMLGSGPAHGMPIRWSEPKPMPSDPLEV